MHSLVGGLVPGSSGGRSGWFIMLCLLWGSFSPFSNSFIGDPVLSPMVGCEHPPLYLSGSGRKYFLASTIVSGFGDCIWDGSPGGVVSG